MLCQNCQKRAATVHFTQVINNNKVEMYLCEQCADQKGQLNFISPFGINNFFPVIMEYEPDTPLVQSSVKQPVCSKCGMTYEEFQRVGKLGCSNCYELFGDKLKPLLRRLHGNIEHKGKIPGRVSKTIKMSKEIEKLKELLNKAVQGEEYEKAAEIRDKIKVLESTKQDK